MSELNEPLLNSLPFLRVSLQGEIYMRPEPRSLILSGAGDRSQTGKTLTSVTLNTENIKLTTQSHCSLLEPTPRAQHPLGLAARPGADETKGTSSNPFMSVACFRSHRRSAVFKSSQCLQVVMKHNCHRATGSLGPIRESCDPGRCHGGTRGVLPAAEGWPLRGGSCLQISFLG